MDKFADAQRFAAELHEKLVGAGVNAPDPLAVVEAGARHLGLDCVFLDPSDPMLKGAQALLDRQSGTILCRNTEKPVERAQLIAHEIGHARLHASSLVCGSEDFGDLSQPEERSSAGQQRVQGYGARERRELQANIFARELLLPKLVVHRLHVDERKTSRQIAELTGLPINLVRQQLFDSLLLPDAPDPKPMPKPAEARLDPSQERAATHRGSPFLLQAGPGTGKTKTLIRRALSLLNEGVDPASILILTFSNRAAGELTDRLAANVPDAAPRIWTGTFHSFGLDLLRRYHDQVGLPADPPLYDKGDAVEMLEEILPTLPLKHYRNLWDPVLVLRDVLEAISRAKDELADSDRYRELAERMLANAGEEEEACAKAEKCLEVAEIYARYECELKLRGAVDFGDLVMRPALLLESDQTVCEEVRERHQHVLVDEYQDVNRASARLLKAVVGIGERLWVVGDARQSIYRFRGASSANMAKFPEQDYPGAEVDQLEVNYRSTQEIVDSFVAVAPNMGASKGMEQLALEARCGGAKRPEIFRYGTLEDEAAGIAANIRNLEQEGISLHDQAVLCRSNRRVSEIAEALEERGVPALHLGSLFERSEVRDLLALMSFSVNRPGDDLIRICAMPRYGVPLQDVHAAIRHIRQDNRPALDILPELSALPGLSKKSTTAFKQLAQDFSGVSGGSTPWDLLSAYLLDRTDLARQMSEERSTAGRLRAVAVWQFLNFIRSPGPVSGGSAIRNTLERIRQLVLLREDRGLRQVPAVALHLDAVRVMTIHASKGLEFQAVHIPGLTKDSLPGSSRGSRWSSPIGMVEGAEQQPDFDRESHQHEEQCLFFVALSRARVRLHLYLAQTTRLGGKKRTESPFIGWLLPDHAVRVDNPENLLLSDGPASTSVGVTFSDDWHLTEKHLIDYEKCPRRFFYTHVLGLERARKTTAFTQTHDCMYELLRWLKRERCRANPLLDAAEARFEEIWQQRGPTGHTYASEYRGIASQLIETAVVSGEDLRFLPSDPIEIDLPGVPVRVEPSEVFELSDGTVVLRHVRTGKKRSDEYDRLEYTLYLMAAKAKFGDAAKVQALHLTDETCEDVSLTDRKLAHRIEKIEDFSARVASGEFSPKPDDTICPRCPHFFICAALPAGPLRPS